MQRTISNDNDSRATLARRMAQSQQDAHGCRVSRRQFLALLSTALLGTLTIGCSRPSPLSVAAHPWPGYELIFLAQREGQLNEQLVKLHETRSATESIRALQEGYVDSAALTLDEVLRARAAGIPLTVVMVFDISAGADAVLARPGITTLRSIRGKRIGVEQSALGALMLAESLKAAGLNQEDVIEIPLTIDQHETAWKQGAIDVLISYPPVSSHILAAGAIKLFDSRQIPDTIVDVLAVRQSMLDEKRAAIRHLIATHFRELDYLLLNPQDASYRMAAHLAVPAAEVLSSLKGIVLPELEYNRRLLDGHPPHLLASARTLVKIMVNEKILAAPDKLERLISADFLPESANEK